MSFNETLVANLSQELKKQVAKNLAISLDFDGVCKLFTEHKHQIMRTCLFLHLYEFQRVPFKVYQEVYREVNSRSKEYAGRERLLCAHGLAKTLAEKGYPTRVPGLHAAVEELLKQGKKISVPNLTPYASAPEVKRALAWSKEVDEKVAKLTEIGLTPGIQPHVFDAHRPAADFYVVSTATEGSLPPHLIKEGIDFILRYLGQETATKTESLLALCRAGYKTVFMFGDSVEDARASAAAQAGTPPGVSLCFVPIIPGGEERCFKLGGQAIAAVRKNDLKSAETICRDLLREFQGQEVAI